MKTKKEKFINSIILGDSTKILPEIEEGSIDVALTDPPYFLDKMDDNWQSEIVASTKNQQIIKSLPAGMKFDREQGQRFYQWYLQISKEIIRVLKPGGFFFSFSSPRLYHRMTSAIDDAGFDIRDTFLWLYTQNQPKAMSLDHFIDKLDIKKEDKADIKARLRGWKTPQIKSCFEPIAVAQKPTQGTYLNNMLKHEVGLFNTSVKIGENMYPANVLTSDSINPLYDRAFLVSKPAKKEKKEYNIHKTVKPLSLCEHLIRLSAFSKDAIVLDPFVGSGTTMVAAKKLGKRYIGIDSNKKYVEIAEKRLKDVSDEMGSHEIENKKTSGNIRLSFLTN